MLQWLKIWTKSHRGNVTMVAGLTALPLLLAVTGVMELTGMSNDHARLQAAADAGALAGAGQLGIATSGTAGMTATAVSVAQTTIRGSTGSSPATFTASADTLKGTVTVSGSMMHKALFGLSDVGNHQITVTSVAENLQKTPLCVLQTNTANKGNGGITVQDNARIRAIGCAVHANQNIVVNSTAMIQADKTQAVGTVKGPVTPSGNSGALPIPDPFASMNLTAPTDCNGKAKAIKQAKNTTVYLAPGVHCEEYDIDQGGTLILQPGEHYFMDDLKANNNAIIQGDDVVLIFGSTKTINFADHATVQLGARKSGPFAGFLMITTRDNIGKFTIASDHVSKLLGTIYIPNAELDVATGGNVAQDSAWSIIVANNLVLKQNPVLTINNNYIGGGIPVPDGVGPSKSSPKLAQ